MLGLSAVPAATATAAVVVDRPAVDGAAVAVTTVTVGLTAAPAAAVMFDRPAVDGAAVAVTTVTAAAPATAAIPVAMWVFFWSQQALENVL